MAAKYDLTLRLRSQLIITQIRNTVLVAQSMAVYEGRIVCEDHLMESITAREQFREHYLGVGASDNLRSYF